MFEFVGWACFIFSCATTLTKLLCLDFSFYFKQLPFFKTLANLFMYNIMYIQLQTRSKKLKYLKIQKLTPIPVVFTPLAIRNGASISNSRWQNRKERPKRSTNNGYRAEKAKRPIWHWVCDIHLIREKLCF